MLQIEELMDKVARCPQCGRVINYGRVDRRFCSVECKNLYHNRQRYPRRDKEARRVLRILLSNHDILDRMLKMGLTGMDRLSLMHLGYRIDYFTSLERQRHRWVYTCLDIRYELTPTRVKNLAYLTPSAVSSEDP